MGTVCPLMVPSVKIKSEKEVDIIGGVSLIYTVVILIWLDGNGASLTGKPSKTGIKYIGVSNLIDTFSGFGWVS